MTETLQQARKNIAELAVDAFSRHRILRLAPHLWKCSRPNSWIYGFFIASLPGALAFWGDLGEAILRPSDYDVMPWLRDAVFSPDYLLSKVQPRPAEEFYPGDALAWAEDNPALLKEAKLRFSRGELHPYAWAELVNEHCHDSEGCLAGSGPSSSSLWLVEALRWFMAHEND